MREKPQDVHEFIESHKEEVRNGTFSDIALAKMFKKTPSSIRAIRNRMGLFRKAQTPKDVDDILAVAHKRKETNNERKRSEILGEEVEKLRAEKNAWLQLDKTPKPRPIKPIHSTGTSEATYFTIASDWHIEERVHPEEVNYLNEYSFEIAKQRAEKFFQRGLRLYRMFAQDVKIDNWVLPLIGDFITSNIHEEFLETTDLAPAEAIWEAQNLIMAGIDFLLNNTRVHLTIPCKSGNHGRITKDQRHATEEGNSLESFMYHNLARLYEKEPRVDFILSDGYHIYLDVYGKTIRIHHGHAMRYGGGVGGLYIPVNKSIAQWNKGKVADLDVFGHFHQFKYGGNFIANGSMVGYNSYALSIKAEYERPQQASFLFDKKRGVSILAPILFL